MAFTPLSPAVLFPDNIDIDKANLRQMESEQNDRLGDLPSSYLNLPIGDMVVLGEGGIGPDVASLGSRTSAITAGMRPFGSFRPNAIPLDAGVTLTDKEHCGKLFLKTSTSASVITIQIDSDASLGVSHCFACSFLRYPGSGTIQVLSNLANYNTAGHTKVIEGGLVTVFVDAESGGFFFKGETEL